MITHIERAVDDLNIRAGDVDGVDLEVFGEDRLQRFNIQVGQEVNIAFDIDAHEYNGRWFNSIRAYDVRLVDEQSQAASQPNAGEGMPMPEAPAVSSADLAGDSAEDLPF